MRASQKALVGTRSAAAHQEALGAGDRAGLRHAARRTRAAPGANLLTHAAELDCRLGRARHSACVVKGPEQRVGSLRRNDRRDDCEQHQGKGDTNEVAQS